MKARMLVQKPASQLADFDALNCEISSLGFGEVKILWAMPLTPKAYYLIKLWKSSRNSSIEMSFSNGQAA